VVRNLDLQHELWERGKGFSMSDSEQNKRFLMTESHTCRSSTSYGIACHPLRKFSQVPLMGVWVVSRPSVADHLLRPADSGRLE
jgi:hypothetical protein